MKTLKLRSPQPIHAEAAPTCSVRFGSLSIELDSHFTYVYVKAVFIFARECMQALCPGVAVGRIARRSSMGMKVLAIW